MIEMAMGPYSYIALWDHRTPPTSEPHLSLNLQACSTSEAAGAMSEALSVWTLMEDVLDKLKALQYETKFCAEHHVQPHMRCAIGHRRRQQLVPLRVRRRSVAAIAVTAAAITTAAANAAAAGGGAQAQVRRSRRARHALGARAQCRALPSACALVALLLRRKEQSAAAGRGAGAAGAA